MVKKLVIFTDGGARGNPGRAAIGIVIRTESGQILQEIYQRIGVTTNNVAEYSAVVKALEWLKNNQQIIQLSNYPIIQFYLDSILVVNQLNGKFRVKNADLRELLLKVRMLEQEVGGQIYYTSIPREENTAADALVNKAFDGNNHAQTKTHSIY